MQIESSAQSLRLALALLDDDVDVPGEFAALTSACTDAIRWCDQACERLRAGEDDPCASTGASFGVPGDFAELRDFATERAGVLWRRADCPAGGNLSIGFRQGRADIVVYETPEGWHWHDLTRLHGSLSGGFVSGPWPNEASAQAKAALRLAVFQDALPGERQAAIAACPVPLPPDL